MLYRKIESTIKSHLLSDSKKILLVDGAKQTGKTYIIRYVGKQLFEHFIELNMVESYLITSNLNSNGKYQKNTYVSTAF